MTINQTEFHQETWEALGSNIEKFIADKAEELKDESFDIIIGFTRGGHIIATILSCLFRDVLPEAYNTNDHKASVRPIPRGISIKRYKSRCFVMRDAASKEDIDDIEELKKDLFGFRNSIKQDKINVLIVDDNLTGSSRLALVLRELKTLDFIDIKSLAYVRHPDFYTPALDYFIRKFPDDKLFFIMPYHKQFQKTEIKETEESENLMFNIRLNNGINLDTMINEIQNTNMYTRVRVEAGEDVTKVFVKRGESVIAIATGETDLSIFYLPHKVYPPKDCLQGNIPAYELPICGFGGKRLEANYCVLCSFLNCNMDVINLLLGLEGTKRVISIIGRDGKRATNLKDVASKWFEKAFNIDVFT